MADGVKILASPALLGASIRGEERSSSLNLRLALRMLLGIVFVVSGVAKMWDIYGFSKIVSGYGVLSESMIVPVSILIPFAEFILGMMLLLNFHARVASLSLLVMVVVFTGLSAMRYLSGATSDCGCFGEVLQRKINANLFVENAALIVALSLIKLKTKKIRRNTFGGGKTMKTRAMKLMKYFGIGLLFAVLMTFNVKVGLSKNPGAGGLTLVEVASAYAQPAYCEYALNTCLKGCLDTAGVIAGLAGDVAALWGSGCGFGCYVGYDTCG